MPGDPKIRTQLKIIEQMARGRWPIDEEHIRKAVEVVGEGLESAKRRVRDRAVDALLKMVRSNQRDQHFVLGQHLAKLQLDQSSIRASEVIEAMRRDPEYQEYLRDRALEEDRDTGPLRALSDQRPGSAS